MDNYFTYYDIAPSIDIDSAALRKYFVAKSRENHPDFHTLADGDTQAQVLIESSRNNQAYKVLKNRELRIKHLLEVNDMISETDTVSQEFLIEAMDVNEAIMEYEMTSSDTQLSVAHELVVNLNQTLELEYDALCKRPLDKTTYAVLKEWYYRKKYVNRMLENLKKAETRK